MTLRENDLDYKILPISDLINIFDYDQPLSLLQKLLEIEKKRNPSFTYEKWSYCFGFRSRSFLKLVVSGQRRITSKFIEKFSSVYKLTDYEKEYFHFLILLDQSKDPNEKKLFHNTLLEIRIKAQLIKKEFDQKLFLFNPIIPHLQTLLTFNDLQKTPANIAFLLGVSEKVVIEILVELEKLGVVEKESKTTWKSKYDFFRVKQEAGANYLREYHVYSLEQAIKAQKLPFNLRRFKSFLVALDQAEFEEIISQFQDFINKSLMKYGGNQLKSKRLFKINFNLYPVTDQVNQSDVLFSKLKSQSGLPQ